jgi:hypothetical protein
MSSPVNQLLFHDPIGRPGPQVHIPAMKPGHLLAGTGLRCALDGILQSGDFAWLCCLLAVRCKMSSIAVSYGAVTGIKLDPLWQQVAK